MQLFIFYFFRTLNRKNRRQIPIVKWTNPLSENSLFGPRGCGIIAHWRVTTAFIFLSFCSCFSVWFSFFLFLSHRCSMEMSCPAEIGRDSWSWVGPPTWGESMFNSPEWVEAPRGASASSRKRLDFCCCCCFRVFHVVSMWTGHGRCNSANTNIDVQINLEV